MAKLGQLYHNFILNVYSPIRIEMVMKMVVFLYDCKSFIRVKLNHCTYFGTADNFAQSHVSGGRVHVDCHASRLRAHVCQRTGIRGRASSRGANLDVCPAGHTCARGRESAGFRH